MSFQGTAGAQRTTIGQVSARRTTDWRERTIMCPFAPAKPLAGAQRNHIVQVSARRAIFHQSRDDR